jgi:putative transposase
MSSVKRILTIRVLGRERKERVRKLLYDLAHFRNMLIILIRKYRLLYKESLLKESILYGLLSSRGYSGKYREEFERVIGNIQALAELKTLLENLRAQKEKVGNPHFIQLVIRQVVKDFKGYFRALQSFRENPEKFKGLPRPPKPKKLRFLMNFSAEGNANTFKQEKDSLLIRLGEGEYLKVKLPKDFPQEVSSVRLKFFGEDLYVDVVYEQELKEKEPEGEYRGGIDVGLDELLAVVSENPQLRSFIVSGREIKAFNQWFNKERAKLRSQMDYLRNEIESVDYNEEGLPLLKKKLRELEIKSKVLSAHRKRWMDTQLHRVARKVVDILYDTGHKVIYVGRNVLESKNGIELGSKTNQEFVSVPFRRLIELIKYKASELGMEVAEIDESYTSKTSPFVDIRKVQRLGREKRELIKGIEQVKEGREELEEKLRELESEIKELRQESRKGNLFKDKVLGKVFHADLVGALNILRVGAKLLKLDFYEDLKVLFVKLCNPVRLKLMDLFFKVTPESLLGIGGSSGGQCFPSGLSLETGLDLKKVIK